jgi:hypothetical protein
MYACYITEFSVKNRNLCQRYSRPRLIKKQQVFLVKADKWLYSQIGHSRHFLKFAVCSPYIVYSSLESFRCSIMRKDRP